MKMKKSTPRFAVQEEKAVLAAGRKNSTDTRSRSGSDFVRQEEELDALKAKCVSFEDIMAYKNSIWTQAVGNL